LIEQKKLIGIITGISMLVAMIAGLVMSPVYRAETLLATVPDDEGGLLRSLTGQFGDLVGLAGINLPKTKDKTAEYVATLNSRSLSIGFINQNNLKPILFQSKWDGDKKQWKSAKDVPTDWEAFEIFDRKLRSVTTDRRSGLVTLVIEWNDPVLAANWANSLVNHANARIRSVAIEQAERSVSYLEKQLAQTSSVEIQQAIYRLIESQTKKKMLAAVRTEYAFEVIDPAVSPEERVSPKRLLMIGAAIILGLMLSIVVAFVRGTAMLQER